MTIYLTELSHDTDFFPDESEALTDPDGLIAIGGDLSPTRLLNAYRRGIFPWYGPGEPLLWWSPSERGVIDPTVFTPSKSLRKFQRKHQYAITINKSTHRVIDLCASSRTQEDTWIHPEMRLAYKQLSDLHDCHSVEVWKDNHLVGGLYGLSIGTIFCGESMFSLESNASKIAFWALCEHFNRYGGQLIDCQMMNPHLESLGAFPLERPYFLQKLLCYKENILLEKCFVEQEFHFK
ncbi:leucyl/phenylalanyl-tRNA--protein transferase [Vibrio sp.]|nr:leucyl/phenylalanyl-tRNA--protein transferase [Vibrio sp.]